MNTKIIHSKIREMEKKMDSVENKCNSLKDCVQEVEKCCWKALTNIDEDAQARHFYIEKLKLEYEWKMKLIEWDYSNKREFKWLNEQVGAIQDKLCWVNPPIDSPAPVSRHGLRKKVQTFLRYGFGVALGAVIGVATTIVSFGYQ